MEQPGRVGELLFLLAHPDAVGHVPSEPRDRRGVPRRATVADVERAHQAGEHTPRQRDVLLGTVARLLQQVRHV